MDTAVPEVTQTSTPTTTTSTSGSSSVTATPTTPATPAVAAASERPNEATTLSPIATRDELAKFLEAKDRAADATTPQSPLVADAAAATTPPTEPIVPGAPVPPAAPPPERWPQILQNARTKAVTEHMQSLGLPSTLTKESAAWVANVAAHAADPRALYKWLGEQLASDPRFRTATPAAAAASTPDVEIMDGQGKVIGKLSDFLQAEREQIRGEFTSLVNPILKEREQRQQQERTAAIQKAQETRADGMMTQINRILRMDTFGKDEQAALGQKLLDEMQRTPDPIEAALTLFERDVLPSLEKRGQQVARETDLKKAAANTASPGGSSAPSLRPNATKDEIVAFLKRQDGVA